MSLYDKASLVQIPSGYKGGSPNGTLYSVLPANGDGDFTHTRASSATRVNKDGLIESVASGVPRLDYPLIDGVVQSCPALLLEPSRMNLVTYSEDFSDSSWFKNANTSVSVNTAISPTGGNNATTLTISTAFPALYHTVTTTASTDYIFTFYVKNKNIDDITYRVYDASNAADIISPTSYYSQIGDDWKRISISFTTPSGCLSTRVYLCSDNSAVGEVYIWGAQVEAGSYPTSYIPTSGSTVTRSADECNGAGTSAEFNDSEGVLFAEIAALTNVDSFRQLAIGNSTDNVKFLYTGVATSIRFIVKDGGINSYDETINVPDIDYHKVALKYKASDFAVYIDGFEYIPQASGTTPSGLAELAFDDGSGGSDFYGKTKQLMVFNQALTDSELEQITSWTSFSEMAKGQLYTIE